jgi:hypothetical protein
LGAGTGRPDFERGDEMIDFYIDRKYCSSCDRYVRYLRSHRHSFCIHCDRKVEVLSRTEMNQLRREVDREHRSGKLGYAFP